MKEKTNMYDIMYETLDNKITYSIVYPLEKSHTYWFCLNLDILKSLVSKKKFSEYLTWIIQEDVIWEEIQHHSDYKKIFSKCLRKYNIRRGKEPNGFIYKDELTIAQLNTIYRIHLKIFY